MSLLEHYASAFPNQIKRRGAEYYESGRVSDVQNLGASLRALVRGSGAHHAVFVDPRRDEFECSCLAFEHSGICKHVWAVLLFLENSTYTKGSDWRYELERLGWTESLRREGGDARITYAIELGVAAEDNTSLRVYQQTRKQNGDWGALKLVRADQHPSVGEVDQGLLGMLEGARRRQAFGYYAGGRYRQQYTPALDLSLSSAAVGVLLPRLAETGRLFLGRKDDLDETPLMLDAGPAWEVRARLEGGEERTLVLELRRGGESISPDRVGHVFEAGYVLVDHVLLRVSPSASATWFGRLAEKTLTVGADEVDDFFAAAHSSSLGAMLEPPEGWKIVEAEEVTPVPVLAAFAGRPGQVALRLEFDYAGLRIEGVAPLRIIDARAKRIQHRHHEVEDAARAELEEILGQAQRDGDWSLPVAELGGLLRRFVDRGWRVEADGARLRSSTGARAKVRSGTDWFDLEGGVEFGDQVVPFPALLAALRAGRSVVRLGDGTNGLLPEEWLRRKGLLETAESEGETLRFRRSQSLLLDLLLESAPRPDVDAQFRRISQALNDFSGVKPVDEPRGFRGELRPYQKEGLGWIGFLESFGFGGCLADDMGLGKTVQVLAYLQSRRLRRSSRGPSLVVAPKSVVANWVLETRRFTPKLSIIDYTGPDRSARFAEIPTADIVVSTYGLVRRDIERLREIEFACVILDEAQAIKNAGSQTAKACRLLRGRQRLALSGTPIENRIEELWSLFDFLNPGMFGSMDLLRELGGAGEEARADLARVLAPFILRRRKDEVAKDLPARVEQTLTCTLPPKQRKLYDELLEHYRASIAKRIDDVGLGKSKMHVLEALMRLRQAACHPALIDETVRLPATAKVDLLMEKLEEIMAEGHKALVFSQFTKFLAIVRDRLDEQGIVYEYLDGRTRKRQPKIDRFQSDEACPLFLISLKAGGTGLNLTAADYVFILDPWWNPAVEAQAIDRTHRIGQTKRVFAYRLIAQDTIEEKILALQEEKRELARSILDGGSRTLRDLTRADLERLFS